MGCHAIESIFPTKWMKPAVDDLEDQTRNDTEDRKACDKDGEQIGIESHGASGGKECHQC